MTDRGGPVAPRLRQWATLDALAERIGATGSLDGAIVVGSFAEGSPDAASDLDLVVCVGPGRFDDAWRGRTALHTTGAVAWWDASVVPGESGAHKWVTDDLVLVECLFAAPGGVRLAPPWRVVAGGADLAERFAPRPPVPRSEMGADVHPVERAYDELKEALRASRSVR